MGLSIARGLLAAQGGRIWAENCADGGAEFTMLVQADGRPGTASSRSHDQPARVLLVDDEVPIQRALAPLFRSRGTKSTSRAHGEAALALVRSRPPDVVVLDLGLPDIEGVEVCRRIRLDSEVPDHRAVGARRGSGQGGRPRPGSRRLRDEALRPGRTAGPHPGGAAPGFSSDETPSGRLQAGDLTVDYDRHRVLRGGDELRLTPKEFDLLELLMRNAGRVLTHRTILKAIWGPNAVTSRSTCGCSSRSSGKSWSQTLRIRATSLSEPWVGYRFAGDLSE